VTILFDAGGRMRSPELLGLQLSLEEGSKTHPSQEGFEQTQTEGALTSQLIGWGMYGVPRGDMGD